ncbi:DUF616 domain-containing protein [Deltaproteobacteria bacterium OttesenSCG-928-K17]|nr:DUF616 domain-containing protein [Deltaproteobacteria bacterium OttesenSCG-928-K17]
MVQNKENKSGRRVVYTCLFGRYEILREQDCPNTEGLDFICFTDRDDLSSSSWTIRKIDARHLGPKHASRLAKLAPHQYLPEYEQSLYIDNSLALLRDPAEIFSRHLPPSAGFACFRHHVRDCLYQEGEEVIYYSMEDEARVREQLACYRAAGFPENAGLYSGNFLLRRHHRPDVTALGEMWLSHFLRYSRRDQLSLPFCASRCGLHINVISGRADDNALLKWAPAEVRRIPYGFDGDEFLWLNPDLAETAPRKGNAPPQCGGGSNASAGKGYSPLAPEGAELYYYERGHQEKRPHLYHRPLRLDLLANKYKIGRGRLYQNRHYYTRIYQQYLAPLQNDAFNLAEIGWMRYGANASALAMWADFFPQAEIIGLDRQAGPAFGNLSTLKCDLGDARAIFNSLAAQSTYKIIIADGGEAALPEALPGLVDRLDHQGFCFIEDTPLSLHPHLKALAGCELHFYDSMDYKSPRFGADALAVVIKE